MKHYTKLFNRIIALSFAVVAISIANSLSQFSFATLPATMLPPSETIQALDEVRKIDIQNKLMANKPATKPVAVNNATLEMWKLYGERVIAISAGAVIGVAAFNFITGGAAVPQTVTAVGGSAAGGATVTSSAISLYAIVSAALGGLAGNYLFMAIQPKTLPVETGQ